MSKKKVGKSMWIEFDTTGMGLIEQQLLSIEPAMIEAQVEALKRVAGVIIQRIRSYIPPSYQYLRNAIIGKIIVYHREGNIFLTVGVGGENAKHVSQAESAGYRITGDSDPILYGRWQEHGYEPVRWEADRISGARKLKKDLKKQKIYDKRKKFQLDMMVKSYHAKARKNIIERGDERMLRGKTDPLHFVRQSRKQSRNDVAAALQEAVNKTAKALESGELDRMFNLSLHGETGNLIAAMNQARNRAPEVIMVHR